MGQDEDIDGEFLDSTVPLSYVVVQKPQTPPSPAYLDGLERLRTSMERTEASRKSLGVQTERTHQYDRSLCVVHRTIRAKLVEVDPRRNNGRIHIYLRSPAEKATNALAFELKKKEQNTSLRKTAKSYQHVAR